MSGILLLLSMAKKGNDMKIAIIGTGNIAHKMAETIVQIKGDELYAVISRNIIRSKAFAERYGCSKYYDNLIKQVRTPPQASGRDGGVVL